MLNFLLILILLILLVLPFLLKRYRNRLIEVYTLTQFINHDNGILTTKSELLDKLFLNSYKNDDSNRLINVNEEGSDNDDIGDDGE